MRIASVSDLHVDFPANREAVVRLATAIHRRGADLVVVAGDISHVDDHIARALRAFALAAPRVAYVPGNHELWFARPDVRSDPSLDSWRRYEVDLRRIAEAEGCHYLPAGPLELGPVAVAGVTGWYDHSLLRPEVRGAIAPEALESKQLGGSEWVDGRYTVFRDGDGVPMGDAAIARRMELALAADLADLDGNPDVTDVVAVTHVLPFREALGPARGLPFDGFDAFMGSLSLGDVIRSSKKVRACIYGHTHRPGAFAVGPIRVHGTPLGYPRERPGISLDALPDRAIGWLEI